MVQKIGNSLVLLFILTAVCCTLNAQSPPDEYFYSENAILPYAHLLLTMPDGSHSSIPFTPVIIGSAPAGIENYSKDIDIRGRLVFAGNGIVAPDKEFNAYGAYNLRGQIPLIVYNIPRDFQQRYGEKSDLHIRVHEAVQRGAPAVIIFGVPGNTGWNNPFIVLPETEPPVTVPVIAVSHDAGISILESAGIRMDLSGYRSNVILEEFDPIEMPVIARLSLKGQFRQARTDHFSVRYLPGILSNAVITPFLIDLEHALTYIHLYLIKQEITPTVVLNTFFPDYTSLKYYTNSEAEFRSDESIYRVFPLDRQQHYPANYYRMVHEITQEVIHRAWGPSLEGFEAALAMMIANNSAQNYDYNIDNIAASVINSDTFTPLIDILHSSLEANAAGADTLIAFASSFFQFLRASSSDERFRNLYTGITEKVDRRDRINFIKEIYFKDLKSLENEWVEKLAFTHGISMNKVDAYLEKERTLISFILSGRTR